MTTPNAFIRKLQGFGPLGADDRQWLESITSTPNVFAADEDLVREGDNPEVVHVMLDGFAARYKLTAEGRRQIFAYLVPGDFCDLHIAVLKRLDHSITTLTSCKIVRLPSKIIREITAQRPELTRALWWSSLVDEAILREWLVNIGQRRAEPRIAHLLCELHVRLNAVGLTDDGSFELPFTQEELADTMALSTVHINRTLKELREEGLATWRSGRIIIPDMERLKEYSGFNPSYLHIR